MIIKEGYWNCYQTFRIRKVCKHLKQPNVPDKLPGVTGYAIDGVAEATSMVVSLLEHRKAVALNYAEVLNDKDRLKHLYEKGTTGNLPEFLEDFDSSLNDRLDQAICRDFGDLEQLDETHEELFNHRQGANCYYYLLMPLKVYFSDEKYEYCHMHVQLLMNGSTNIKLEVPLKNVPAECFWSRSHAPWFSKIKVWGAFLPDEANDEYVEIESEQNGVTTIQEILRLCANRIFSETIVDGARFTSFQTFVLTECSGCNLPDFRKNNESQLQQMYHFMFPENCMYTPSKETVLQQLDESHLCINGFHCMKSTQDQLVMYAGSEWTEEFAKDEPANVNAHLQGTLAINFDPFITQALAQKDNEITIYFLSQENGRSVERNKELDAGNADCLDRMLIGAPPYGMRLYNEVCAMLDNLSVNFQDMLNRTRFIEEHARQERDRRRSIFFNVIIVGFTVIFGLPTIQSTLVVLKDTVGFVDVFISTMGVNFWSVIFWIAILAALLVYLLRNKVRRFVKQLRINLNYRRLLKERQ